MTNDVPQEYESTDLGCATYLVTKGHKILRIDGEGGTRRLFVFPAIAQKDATDYWDGNDKVDSALGYFTNLKHIKSRIHNE